MKRILLILAIGILMLSACNDNKKVSSETQDSHVVVNEIDKPYKIIAYEENIGGSNMIDFGGDYQLIYYGMDTALCNLVSESQYQEWIKSFDSGSKDWNICVQADFISFFGLNEEQVREAIGMSYSEEQIRALVSNDSRKIDEAFINPYAVYSDGKIYSPEWFAVHTWSDYLKAGISQDVLLDYISKWDEELLIIPILQTTYQLKQHNVNVNLDDYNSISGYVNNIQLYGIPDSLRNTLTDSEYENYVKQFTGENVSADRPLSEFNIVNFLTDYKIEYADFVNLTKDVFTTEEQRVIFSRNYDMIDKLFER